MMATVKMQTITTTRPKLPQLQTPKTGTFPASAFSTNFPSSAISSAFPSELSALSNSARSPLPGWADWKIKLEDGIKTPITPPIAYTDFLKTMSPVRKEKTSGGSTPTSAPSTEPSSDAEASSDPPSEATSASEHSTCSCSCETHKSPTTTTADISSTTATTILPSPRDFKLPASAPSSARLPASRIPPSPLNSGRETPLSATSSMRSPYNTRSPFDWEITSGKGRYFDLKSPRSTRSGIRHVREVLTRTVTYTPTMSPAPKGKRRKLNED